MAPHVNPNSERIELDTSFRRFYSLAIIVGGVASLLAILLTFFIDSSFRRFYFAWMVAFAFFLSISLGGIFFVLIQHVTRAGWSVGVRRIAEVLSVLVVLMLPLSAPILISVLENHGKLYRWAQPLPEGASHDGHNASPMEHHAGEQGGQNELPHSVASSVEIEAGHAQAQHPGGVKPLDPLTIEKRPYLNRSFFLLRVLIYFAIWGMIAVWFWKRSVEQDQSGNVGLTTRMETYAPVLTLVFALVLTFGSFDLFMSLDPAWYSTMFGVYYFAGCAVAIFASLIIITYLLQRVGYLTESVTKEHFHDLGKFLFAFTFFWGYIAFSQYMLIWYANLPEETQWFSNRGATTVDEHKNGWSVVIVLLLLGHLMIPFAGLLSRHIKRRKGVLVFWAVWMLVFHYLDLLWLIMPEYDSHFTFGFVEILSFIAIGGFFVAGLVKLGMQHKIRPAADPRLGEALALQNM